MNQITCDVLVVGGGSAGFAAAVTAAYNGAKVILIEKAHLFGGATCWSGGWMWVPNNQFAKAAGIHETDEARTYLQAELKERFDAKRIDKFLEIAPKMIDFFEHNTDLQFDNGNKISDIHGHSPGAKDGGRSVIAKPIHGKELGKLVNHMRPPMKETGFMGMPIMAGKDLWAFLNATRSASSFLYAAKRISSHIYDVVRYGRTMQFCNGSALIARLAKSTQKLDIEIMVNAQARELLCEDNKVVGAIVRTDKGDQTIRTTKGIILTTGGYAHDLHRRFKTFPHMSSPQDHWPLPPKEVSGDGLNMAEKIGAAVSDNVVSAAAWCPVSIVPYKDGSTGHFPHIIDRAKPGTIAVLKNGKRFVNEADGYYDFVDAMIKNIPEHEEVAAWLICSYPCQRRYGLGMTRPFPFSTKPWIKSGYLKIGKTLDELAQNCGIDATELKNTVTNFNKFAEKGEDPEFARGTTGYNKKMGDPSHTPNPSLAPLEKGPFFAIKIQPGSFATFAGLKTNEFAQVLNKEKHPIKGLYTAGVDMESIMMGNYPTGGINLGPAMTFGYIAGHHILGKEP